MKGNVVQNVWFLIKRAYQVDKGLFVYFGFYTILTALSPFISLFTIKFLIDELMGLQRLEVIVALVGGMFISQTLVDGGISWVKACYEPRLIAFRFVCIEELEAVNMNMAFQYTEDPETLNQHETAWKALNNNSEGIEGVFHKLFSIFGGLITLCGYMGLLLWLSPWLLLYLVASVVVTYVLNLKAKKYEYAKKDEVAALQRRHDYLYDTMSDFSYGKDIRLFQLQKWLRQKLVAINEKQVALFKNIQHQYLLVLLLDAVLIMIREGLIYGYLMLQVIANLITIGNFSMYATTVANFSTLLKTMMDDFAFIRLQNLYIQDYRDYLTKAILTTNNQVVIPRSRDYEIEFVNVSFKYPKSDRYIFENLNLKIEGGQRLAIVGINGAGKTTLIKLLTRLYEPTSGHILLNGQDISTFNLNDYHQLFSVVFQEIKVMGFSVAENVSATTHEAIDEARVHRVLKQAGLEEKIQSLTDGIKTPLLKVLDDEGVELSGGQNQKLALARALYKQGDIVVLDEPTAALDALAEYETYQNFNQMIGQKTAIYVSHRLSSTRFCDVIAYFENGEIVEYGTHESLLALEGHYANMFNVQSQYYQDTQEAM